MKQKGEQNDGEVQFNIGQSEVTIVLLILTVLSTIKHFFGAYQNISYIWVLLVPGII